METQWLPVSLVVWIIALAGVLDARQPARFIQLRTGLLFGRGRRTVTSWLRDPLGRGGVQIYRVLVRRTPEPTYIELREDQLQLAPAKV
jgi:hypothetical protein